MNVALARLVITGCLLALPTTAQTVWYVDDDTCPGTGSGTALDPFCSIQTALGVAVAGDTVFVGPGTYFEKVVMKTGVDLIGSGAATTSIDAGGSGSTVTGADDAILDGFLITGAGGLNEHAINLGNGSSPTISNNTISGNKTNGMIALSNSKAVIVGNTVIGDASFVGGCPCDCIWVVQSAPTIVGNRIEGTDPNGNVEAIWVAYISEDVTDSFLIENNFILGDIELESVSSSHELHNVTRGNVMQGLGLAFSSDAGLFANNTLIGGFGIFAQGMETLATLENNILAFCNTGIELFGGKGAVVMNDNDVYGNSQNYVGLPDQTGINGNMSEDPLFVDMPHDDFRLRPASPCIDAGSSTADPVGVDQGGTPRVLDGDLSGSMVVDIGAFELTRVRLDVTGNAAPGGHLTFSAMGSPDLVGIVVVGTVAGAVVFPPYGAVLFDPGAPYVILSPAHPLPIQVSATVPPGIVTPLTLHVQALGVNLPTGLGNFSNQVTLSIE